VTIAAGVGLTATLTRPAAELRIDLRAPGNVDPPHEVRNVTMLLVEIRGIPCVGLGRLDRLERAS
jgi:hypothetical protein